MAQERRDVLHFDRDVRSLYTTTWQLVDDLAVVHKGLDQVAHRLDLPSTSNPHNYH